MRAHLYKKNKKVPTLVGTFLMTAILLISESLFGQKTSKIEIINANTLEYEELNQEKVKRLIGDVQLKHEDALMFCDSAYIFSNNNTMDAYGNVRISQGDSLNIYGDSLKYNGNTRMALLRGDIRLVNSDVTLTTNYLDYDRNNDVAYYYGGGTTINQKENNKLTSEKGYYYSKGELFYFKEEVLLHNPDYDIKADTLNYNSSSEIVNFLGPTTISSEDNFIYTEDGWYDTENNQSKFYKNAYLYTDNKIITGDTLYYDRNSGQGEIICNATITDTTEDIITGGDWVLFFEKNDSAMITQEAQLQQLMDDDTLFMHADTFFISTRFVARDSLIEIVDSINYSERDTVRTLFAYNRVKFYKNDMQGKADSLVYSLTDSTIKFYHDPIIWSEENQMTADFIYLLMSKGKVEKIYMDNNSFIISKVDSIRTNYNQIKGKNMVGYFNKNKLYKIDVKQNAETIYYVLDDDEKYIGVNKLTGSDMFIRLENNEIETITFIEAPQGEMSPLKDLSPKDLILKGFNWRANERPIDRFDIFNK